MTGLAQALRAATRKWTVRVWRGLRFPSVAGNREYDEDRFAELVLYIAWKASDDPDFGRVKRAKTLFYCDLAAYAEEGQSLTGATYEHWPHGPFPPVLYSVEKRLVAKGLALLEGDEGRLVVYMKPDAPHFDGHPLVDRYVAKFMEQGTWDVRAKSHQHPGWWITPQGEEIPYHVAFMSRREPTEADLERGEELARKHGWP